MVYLFGDAGEKLLELGVERGCRTVRSRRWCGALFPASKQAVKVGVSDAEQASRINLLPYCSRLDLTNKR